MERAGATGQQQGGVAITNHTPGPWIAGPVGPGLAQIQGGKREIAVVRPIPQWDGNLLIPTSIWNFADRQKDGTYRDRPRDHEALANVRLLTAAPALLGACRLALNALETRGAAASVQEFLRKTIAEAAPEEAEL